MLCKNCNYILSGKENFCPNCAVPLKEEASTPQRTVPEIENEAEENKEESIINRDMIFQKSEPKTPPRERNMHIFYDMEEKEEPPTRTVKEKSYTGRIFLLLFVTCALAIAAFGVADYFGITSSVFSFIQTVASGNEEENVEDFSHSKSIIAPDVNYSPTAAYIMSGEGLTLRKGPGNSYAPLCELSDLTAVQIHGGSLANKSWVYVYCAENESYGWLDGSFLAREKESETTLSSQDGGIPLSQQSQPDASLIIENN